MTRRRSFDTTYHAAYMTRVLTESAKLTDVESPDANIITTDPDVTDISPSSSELNRREAQQQSFSSPFLDQLYKRSPEPSSGGGGDTKPKAKTKPKPSPKPSPLQHVISSDVTLVIESTILEPNFPPVSRTDLPNYYLLLG
jgi:hypothetical protein